MSDIDSQRLRALSEKCGGWITFDDKDGEIFVALSEWTAMFKRKASQAAE
jgi:hypothetical protein